MSVDKNLGRLINFSDAVIAIAVTLLVLPLVTRAESAHISSYGAFVSSFGHLIIIFVISFFVICRYWEVHHELFNSVRSFSDALFWLNALWLLSIAFIPFTSELSGNANYNVFTTSVYIISLLLTSYVGLAIQQVIVHTPSIQKETVALEKSYGLASAIAMTLALIISIIFPSIGLWSLLLLIPASRMSRRSHAKSHAKK